MIDILKIIFLFIAVFFTINNTFRLIAKNDNTPMNVIIHAIGITGFIYLQFLR